eukprot:scaffold31147_cov36-Prasinocladus_malaysianus.AAC.2
MSNMADGATNTQNVLFLHATVLTEIKTPFTPKWNHKMGRGNFVSVTHTLEAKTAHVKLQQRV